MAATTCRNPSPSRTPAMILDQILCCLRGVFGTGKITVDVNSPLPFGADEVDLTFSGSFLATAVYKKAGATVKTATCTNDGTNITSVIYI